MGTVGSAALLPLAADRTRQWLQSFLVRTHTETELQQTLGDMLPQLYGYRYHDVAAPAWFDLLDFKVLLLGKPHGTPKA